ncbi:hypothetical protein M9Y10_008593 [Tritrichomonas musculus]|uniref:Uncharacterized protein n=1 Tax=Tritrichomonas musculus TaxID=1915356 RepID=A0ABR2IYL4_9EUKA
MTHFSANEILAQIVYGFDCGADISFATIAHNSERIFRHGCFDPLANAEDEKASINNYAFSLFSVDHDFSERDFIGFTQRDYIDLHRTIIIQTNGDKSVLSFNLYAGQHNKELDDIQKCTREDNFADDNNNNAHL